MTSIRRCESIRIDWDRFPITKVLGLNGQTARGTNRRQSLVPRRVIREHRPTGRAVNEPGQANRAVKLPGLTTPTKSCPWVGLSWVGLGRAGSRFFSFWWVGLGPLQQNY